MASSSSRMYGAVAARRIDVYAISMFTIAAIVFSIIAGKDLNWDQLNYHFYVAHSLLEGRLQHDFMPANGQSYLNPTAYVPFYWMVRHEWPSVIIGSVLAAFHATNIALAYLVAKIVVKDVERLTCTMAIMGGVLAFLSPMFLMTLGTTFADVSTSAFVLAAVYVSLRFDDVQPRIVDPRLLAGVCFGVASGLKLSNAMFAPAFAVLLVCLHPSWKGVLRAYAYFAAGALAGMLVSHGYWSWQLWRAFGDPVVPTVASFFGAPFVPAGPTLPQRFLPETVLDAVVLPFKMALIQSWTYVEVPAPDLRFAALAILAACAVVARFARPPNEDIDPSSAPNRRRRALSLFFVTSVAMWIMTSANGRYGIMVSVLCGPTLVVAVQSIWKRRVAQISALAILTVLQLIHLQHAQLRWTSEEWTASWYEPSIPGNLRENPYLYVSVGGNSNSYLAPFLAPGSAFTNPVGQVSIDLDGPGGARLRELLLRFDNRIRVVAPASSDTSQGAFDKWQHAADAAIARLNLAIDVEDCQMISTAGPHWKSGDTSVSADEPGRNQVRVCGTIERAYQHAAERARVIQIVNTIAEWCPRLFQPRNSVVEQSPFGWYVNYVSTDTTLEIKGKRITLTQPRSSADINLGTFEDWMAHSPKPSCEVIPTRLRNVHTFR